MRSLGTDARYLRRVQVIALRDAGKTYDEIAKHTGLSRTGVFDICKRHEADGLKALHDAPNGRKTGDGRALNPREEIALRRRLMSTTPDQLALPGLLWTPAGVASLFARQRGQALSSRTVGRYLLRWGYVFHRHTSQIDEPAAPTLRRGIDQSCMHIEMRARQEDAELHWFYCALLQDADKGQSAAGQATLLSTVTNQGHRYWMAVKGPVDAMVCIDFLRRLIEPSARKLFLVVTQTQRLRSADAQLVAEWLAAHDEHIEVFRQAGNTQLIRPGLA